MASARGLDRYMPAAWGPNSSLPPALRSRSELLPVTSWFMCEVARLAQSRGYNQEKLAELYRDHYRKGSKVKSRNVAMHFLSKRRPARKVIATYQDIFSLDETYVELLLALNGDRHALKPSVSQDQRNLRDLIDDYLRPREVEPLFKKGAISAAVDRLTKNTELGLECVNTAELYWQRVVHRIPGVLAPEVHYEVLIARGVYHQIAAMTSHAGAKTPAAEPSQGEILLTLARASAHQQAYLRSPKEDEYPVKWFGVVAPLLAEKGFDLLSRRVKRSQNDLAVDSLLLNVFRALAPANVRWAEWQLIKEVVVAVAQIRGLPVESLVARLEKDDGFAAWDFSFNPDREEQRRQARMRQDFHPREVAERALDAAH